jgi:hypothetical protein
MVKLNSPEHTLCTTDRGGRGEERGRGAAGAECTGSRGSLCQVTERVSQDDNGIRFDRRVHAFHYNNMIARIGMRSSQACIGMNRFLASFTAAQPVNCYTPFLFVLDPRR